MRESRLVQRLAVVAVAAAAFLAGPLAGTAHADHFTDCQYGVPTLTPASQVVQTGGTATVTAQLLDSAGSPCIGYTIIFDISGLQQDYQLTDFQGKATDRFSRSSPTVDTVSADNADSEAYGGPVLVRWVAPPPAPTTLVANPSVLRLSGLKLYLTLSGHLSTANGPVAGQPVTFSASGKPVCTAVTNANGDASCGGLIPGTLASILGGGYTASYAGNSTYLPSSSHGALIA